MQESHQSESMFPETEVFGTFPTPSESFGTVPHRSESFRSVPNSSASFRTVPNDSERTADHTLIDYHYMLNSAGGPAGAIHSRWFEAAALVTGLFGVGAADKSVPNGPFLSGDAERYLRDANEYLFAWNTANFLKLADGLEIPGLEGKRGKELDYALVRFEQMKVDEFTQSYFAGKPQALKANIMNQINKNFSLPLVPEPVKMALRSRFSGVGKSFNFESLTDRINLGRGIIDVIYERPLGIIYEW